MPDNAANGGLAEVVPATPLAESSSPAPDTDLASDAPTQDAKRAAEAARKAAKQAAKDARKEAKKVAKTETRLLKERKAEEKAELKAREKADKKAREANDKANERAAAAVERKAQDADGSDDAKRGKKSKEEKTSGRLRFESAMDREEVASYLEAIVKGLRKGSVQFRQADASVTLNPSSRVDLSVRVASKPGQERLAFEVEWSTDEPQELTIVSG